MVKTITFVRTHFELLFWLTGLTILFFVSPGSQHFTLCPISNLGFDFCPGCGIGRSLHFAMWFDFKNSFISHPLGLAALPIILMRVFTLFKKFKTD